MIVILGLEFLVVTAIVTSLELGFQDKLPDGKPHISEALRQ